ncbi:MAG: GNAT family N-acetyltransferase [Actinoplanes sp.]
MADTNELTHLLQHFKTRGGRSYEALAARTGISRSSLHRYCSGQAVPKTFEPLHRLGQACALTRDELLDLHRCWAVAAAATEAARAAVSPKNEPVADHRTAVLVARLLLLLLAATQYFRPRPPARAGVTRPISPARHAEARSVAVVPVRSARVRGPWLDGGVSFTVTDVAERERFEARDEAGELVGVLTYQLTGPIIAYTHTRVEPQFEGSGAGSELARAAMDDARAKGRTVVPICPFLSGWLEKHPEYDNLVARSTKKIK